MIHIGLSLFAYATLIIAALYALQLAWIDYQLKNKKLAFTQDMPPLLSIERKMFHITQVGVVLLTLVLWRLAGRSKTKTFSLAAVLVATGLSALQRFYITPKINGYRNVDHAAFDRFHHLASTNYTTISVFVLIALVFAITATRRELLLRIAAS